MAFVDAIQIRVRAGKGGDGVVRFRHEKYKEFSGPSGGDGGNGGDVYVSAVRDLSCLARYQHHELFAAEDGDPGGNNSRKGKQGNDITIVVPVGSVITNRDRGTTFELLSEGERVMVARGGVGGKGNEHFKSSTNQAPRESRPGSPGESFVLDIEVKLIADIGLVGFPNAGKSSLLNALTAATATVGAYPFTTLEPNLGVRYGYTIADIPGLIEGASSGKGLGTKFLRHITRTRALAHCIACDTPDPLSAYDTIRKELGAFDLALLKKPEIVIVTKRDMVSSETLASLESALSRHTHTPVVSVSILDDESVKACGDAIVSFVDTVSLSARITQ